MTEQEALKVAIKILRKANGKELTIAEGEVLLELENDIDDNKFGDLIEEFYTAAPIEVSMGLLNCSRASH